MTTESLALGSLFDGSGGFPIAAKLAGIRPVWSSEIEPFAVRVTDKRLPEVKTQGYLSLDLREGGRPSAQSAAWVFLSLGEYSTLAISESPNVAAVSTLSEILTETPPDLYFLRPPVLQTILKHVIMRGSRLSAPLFEALRQATPPPLTTSIYKRGES